MAALSETALRPGANEAPVAAMRDTYSAGDGVRLFGRFKVIAERRHRNGRVRSARLMPLEHLEAVARLQAVATEGRHGNSREIELGRWSIDRQALGG